MRVAVDDGSFARLVARVQAALDLPAALVAGARSPTVCHEILEEVATKHGTTIFELTSERRFHWLRDARQEAMYRCVTETQHSLPTIGKVFYRDHTTVIHGSKRYAAAHGLRHPGRRG